MHFDEIGPWRNPVVPPKSKAPGFAAGGVQSGGAAHTRILSVGAHHPPARRKPGHIRYVGVPEQPDAELGRTTGEDLMQPCAPHGQSAPEWETCLHGGSAAQKADAPKWKGVAARKPNSQPLQCLDAARQDSFTAGFIDRRMRGVDHRDIESFGTGRDCGGQPGRATTDY